MTDPVEFNPNTLFRLTDAANDITAVINAVVHSYTMEPGTMNGDGMDEALVKLLEVKDDLSKLVNPSPRPAIIQNSNADKPYAEERDEPVPTNSDIDPEPLDVKTDKEVREADPTPAFEEAPVSTEEEAK